MKIVAESAMKGWPRLAVGGGRLGVRITAFPIRTVLVREKKGLRRGCLKWAPPAQAALFDLSWYRCKPSWRCPAGFIKSLDLPRIFRKTLAVGR